MSPTRRQEDQAALKENRRVTRALAEATANLTLITQQLNELLADLVAKDQENEDDENDS